MLRIAKCGNQDEWDEMMEFFVPIVGSFLLLYRELPASVTATTMQKITRKHRNLVVFSLLLLSFWKDYGQRELLQKLLTLNLFDSYRDNHDELESVFAEYEDLLNKNIVLSEQESIDMIHQCYAAYRAFIQHKDTYKQLLSPSIDTAIIFRQSFGFLLMTDIGYSSQSTKERKVVVCNAIAPGFPELLPSRNRIAPPRGLISKVTLIASAFVLEKR